MTDREEVPGRPAGEEIPEPAPSAPVGGAMPASAGGPQTPTASASGGAPPGVNVPQTQAAGVANSQPRPDEPPTASAPGVGADAHPRPDQPKAPAAETPWRFAWDASSPSPPPREVPPEETGAKAPVPAGEAEVAWSEPAAGDRVPGDTQTQPGAGAAPGGSEPRPPQGLVVPPRLGPGAPGAAPWPASGQTPPPGPGTPGAFSPPGQTPPPAQGAPGPGSYPRSGQTPPPGPFAPVPPRRGSTGWLPWFGGGCLGCLGALVLGTFFLGMFGRIGSSVSTGPLGGSKIGVVYVEGPIMGGRGGYSILGSVGGADAVIRQLAKARTDGTIRAVVLRINSPGGSAAASQEIWEEVMRLRRARKPVIASMGDTAASGGYYIASAADQIVANGSTLTGSIGVIMEMQNLEGLYRKVGIGSNTIKSGKYKDMGSASRPMTAEEKQLLQRVVNDVYEQFVDAVVEGRKGKIAAAELRKIADGRIFTGRQAHRLKLVDEIGSFQDAIRIAARSAGISGEPRVLELGRTSFIDMLAGETESSSGLRLPGSATEEQKLLKALRRLMSEEGSRAIE